MVQPTYAGLLTGEAVAVELREARLGSRAIAFLLDLIVEIAVGLLLTLLVSVADLHFDEALVAALSLTTVVLLIVGYPTIAETFFNGRTLGKAAMGLRVVRDDGGRAGFFPILMRNLAGVFERLSPLVFVAIITMMASRRGKRVGDLLAGTIVIQTRVPHRGGAVATMPAHLAPWAAGLDLSRLPDALALSVREFIARADRMSPQAREQLGAQLVQAVATAVGWPPPGTPPPAFLAAVVAERRRREELRLASRTARQAAYDGMLGPHGSANAPDGPVNGSSYADGRAFAAPAPPPAPPSAAPDPQPGEFQLPT